MTRAVAPALMLSLLASTGGRAQFPARVPACVVANDAVTAARLGRDRSGAGVPRDVSRAVATGQASLARCGSDDGFMLAYTLARIDLARDASRGTPQSRTALFNSAVADLEVLKAKVLAGRSDRFEIFNVLGLIYYETGQYMKSLTTIDASAPVLPQMSIESRQKMFVTRGMAQAQLGKSVDAARSFDTAVKFGHPEAAAIKRKMLGTSARY